MILDSTFLNDLVREDDDAVETLDELIESETPVAISSLTVFEVGVGLRGPGERFRNRFQELVKEITEVPFGLDEARTSLEIQRELYDRGEAIGAVDVLIAGTAANRPDPTVMTHNVDEFERVDAIDVVSY